MQKNFEASLERVLEHEGGYVDHPADPGGATNRGITLKVFRAFYGKHLGKSDLRDITEREAGAIYKANYWDKCQCDKLAAGVDYVVFDQAVNSGPARSARWLQAAVGARQDGAIGPATLAAAHSAQGTDLVKAMCATRLRFLKSLSHWKDFGRGWKKRVDGVLAVGLELAGGGRPAPPAAPVAAWELVRQGAEGVWVRRLQQALNGLVEAPQERVKVDGKFGAATRRSLVKFQRDAGLDADGVAGYNTYQALGLVG